MAAVPGTVISFEDELRLGGGEHGRDLGGDIALFRHYAVLRAGPSGITIEDLGSTNGTFLNGNTISGVRQVRRGTPARSATAGSSSPRRAKASRAR